MTEDFTNVVEAERHKLVLWLLKKTNDYYTAEDIAQEACLKLWREPDQVFTAVRLYRIGKCKLMDHYRLACAFKRAAYTSCSFSALGGIEGNSHMEEALERREELERVLSLMTDAERELMSWLADGVSYQEMAQRLDVPVGTVRSRVNQARKAPLRTKRGFHRNRRPA